MKLTRTITLSLVLAAAAVAPAAALASHGADDNPAVADDHGGQLVTAEHPPGTDDRGGQGAASSSKAANRAARRATGQCTGNSTAKLKVKPDNGRLQTEFEVDENRNGVTWTVTIRRNGNLAAATNAVTKAPSGSFTVERRLLNGSGSDKITARATSPSGEVCTASITV